MKSKILISTSVLLFLMPVHSSEWYLYTVRKHDVLLKILKAHELERKSLQETIALNPALVKRKGDLIFPGQEIYLPIPDPKTQTTPTDIAVVEETPAPVTQRETSSEELKKSSSPLASLTLSIGTGFLRSVGKDSSNFSGTTDSKNYYFTNLSYRQNWEEIDLTSVIDLGFHSIELSPPQIEKHSKEKFRLASYGAGIEKGIKTTGRLLGGIHFNPLFYVYSKTGQIMNTDMAQLGTLNLGWKQRILNHKKMNAHLILNALSTLPQKTSSMNFKSGWGGEIGYQTEYRHEDWGIQGNVNFKKSFIKTNIEDIEQTGFAVSLGVTRYFE